MKAQRKLPHKNVYERLIQLWWIQLPIHVAQLSRTLGNGLCDGLYLVQWPIIAGIGPPLAMVLGALVGAIHPGETFTSSSLAIALLIAIGLLSANLGVWVVSGYAIGDFFLHSHASFGAGLLENLLQVRVPLLLSYYLLSLSVIVIPLILISIRLRIRQLNLSARLRRLLEALVYVTLAAAMTYGWSIATAVLIRPVYTWQGNQPPVSAIFPLQQRGWILGLTAAIVVSMRLLLEARTKSPRVTRLASIMSQTLGAVSDQNRGLFVNQLLQLLIGAVSLTLLMSGMIANWLEALLVFVFLLGVLWARNRIQESSWPPLRILTYVPWLIRFLIGLILSFFTSRIIVSAMWNQTQSFRPVLLATCISVAILTLLTVVNRPVMRNAVSQSTTQPHG